MVVDVLSSMALFAFGLGTLLAGAFTAYFGAGSSRGIGAGLIVLGLVGLGLFGWFTALIPINAVPPVAWSSTMAVDGVFALIGAVVGGVVALGVFLVSIMRA